MFIRVALSWQTPVFFIYLLCFKCGINDHVVNTDLNWVLEIKASWNEEFVNWVQRSWHRFVSSLSFTSVAVLRNHWGVWSIAGILRKHLPVIHKDRYRFWCNLWAYYRLPKIFQVFEWYSIGPLINHALCLLGTCMCVQMINNKPVTMAWNREMKCCTVINSIRIKQPRSIAYPCSILWVI